MPVCHCFGHTRKGKRFPNSSTTCHSQNRRYDDANLTNIYADNVRLIAFHASSGLEDGLKYDCGPLKLKWKPEVRTKVRLSASLQIVMFIYIFVKNVN